MHSHIIPAGGRILFLPQMGMDLLDLATKVLQSEDS